jgi:hypothetical protein
VVIVATPLATLWFDSVMALSPALVELSRQALWLALPLSLLAVLQSWYQGTIVHSKHTRGVTESVILYLVVTAVVMGIGITVQRFPGLTVAVFGLDAAVLIQVGWLWYRSRPAALTLKTLAPIQPFLDPLPVSAE